MKKRFVFALMFLVPLILVVGLVIYMETRVDENNSDPAPPEIQEITAELSNVNVIEKRPDDLNENTKRIEADLVIYNNSGQTIGLDPNNCDYKVYINDQPLAGFEGCTLIGGVNEVKPGATFRKKVYPYPPTAKEGDAIYVEYGYMILLPENKGNGYGYENLDNKYVRSNTEIVK